MTWNIFKYFGATLEFWYAYVDSTGPATTTLVAEADVNGFTELDSGTLASQLNSNAIISVIFRMASEVESDEVVFKPSKIVDAS